MLEPCGFTNAQPQLLSDEVLMAHAQQGHHDALAVIVARYQRLVWSIAAKILRDAGEAEDVVQAVFVEVFQKMALFNPGRGTLKVWLMQFAYGRSINRRYHLQRRQFYKHNDVEQIESAQPTFTSALFGLTRGEVQRFVQQLLSALPESQRRAIESVYLEGLTFEELAERTGQTIDASKHQYYRGMTKLRKQLRMGAEQQSFRREVRTRWGMAHARTQSI